MKAINIIKEVNEVEGVYIYKKIGIFNSNVMSVVQVENRTLDVHIHEHSDEVFYVIEGCFELEVEDQKINVSANEFVIVPKGVRHRPIVGQKTKFLMIELSGTLTKENSGSLYQDS